MFLLSSTLYMCLASRACSLAPTCSQSSSSIYIRVLLIERQDCCKAGSTSERSRTVRFASVTVRPHLHVKMMRELRKERRNGETRSANITFSSSVCQGVHSVIIIGCLRGF